jgi:hypothetical protein
MVKLGGATGVKNMAILSIYAQNRLRVANALGVTNGREEGVRKKGDPRFLFSTIRHILPLLPVLPSKIVNNAFKSF